MARLIPTKIVFYGDREKCQSVLGVARKRLVMLQERIERGMGLVQQGWQQPITLVTGEIIRLGVSFNTSVIEIFAKVNVGHGVEQEMPEEFVCWCNCNMSVGMVTTAVLTGTKDTPYENVGLDEAPFYVLSVEICQGKTAFVGFENIIGSDFTPWQVGQTVVVLAYNRFLFGCCLPDPAAMGPNFEMFSATGCNGSADIFHPDMDDDYWRTAYRVVQFCGLNLPLREQIYG